MKAQTSTLDLKALLDIHEREIFTNLHCHKLGIIEKFYHETQTADIQIIHKAVVGESTIEYPKLYDVPVFVPAGGEAALTMPITNGDTCLVLFSDRDMDTWLVQGKTDEVPPSRRKHDITDGLAIVGFRSKKRPITDYNPTEVELRNASGRVAIDEKGVVSIKNDNSNLLDTLITLIDCLKEFTVVNTVPIPSTATPAETIPSKTNAAMLPKLEDIKTKFKELLK